MLNSDALRRLVAVVLVVAALVVLPAAPALASGSGADEDQGTSEGEDSGLLAEIIEWLDGLLNGAEEGDNGPQLDPMGLS
jgi:hypothetical protein